MASSWQYLSAHGMHANEMVELAAVVALHGGHLIEGDRPVPEQYLQQYWLDSRCRFDRWGRAIKQLGETTDCSSPRKRDAACLLLQEILAAEALTRVWTAVLTACDESRQCDHSRPVAARVFHTHTEVRYRTLELLNTGRFLSRQDATQLVKLHRRIGRWSDLLIAYVQQFYEVSCYAFAPERCRDFAADLQHESQVAGGTDAQLTLRALQNSLCHELIAASPHADLNFKIAASILCCFDSSHFDSTGALRWLWQLRLFDSATDCQSMLDELLGGV